MPLVIAPSPWLIFLDDTGAPVPNGQLALYEAGTSTPVTVYADSLANVPHPWPITLDAAGRIPGGLFLIPEVAYKFVLHEPKLATANLTGAILKTQDNVMGHGGKVNVSGSVPDAGQLPDTGEPGDAFISADDGHLWIWDDVNGIWVDVGPVQGPPGMTGPVGPKGDTGDTGPQGATGAHGPQGIQGIPGATGPQGAPGLDGTDGIDGATGATGPQGPQGVPGPEGEGTIGPQGPQGPIGPDGPIGPSGPPGAEGPKGDMGDTGPAGVAGPHHATHETGGADAIVALAGEVITTGTVADARLSANIPRKDAVNTFTAAQIVSAPSALVRLVDTAAPVDARAWSIMDFGGVLYLQGLNDASSVESGHFRVARTGETTQTGPINATGSGSTPLTAANLTGTVADARLSANVPLKNSNNTFGIRQDVRGVPSDNAVYGVQAGPGTGVGSQAQMATFRAQAFGPAYELLNAASNLNYYMGLNEPDQSLHLGAGTTPGSGIPPAIKYTYATGVLALVTPSVPGVKFPGNLGDNPSADALTLDDYREQSFFPTITSAGGASGQVYAAQNGLAIKIGGMVHISGGAVLSNKGSLSGALRLGGLPWACSNRVNSAFSIGFFSNLNIQVSSLGVLLTPGQTYGDFHYVAAVGATGMGALDASQIPNTFGVYFSFSYPVNGV